MSNALRTLGVLTLVGWAAGTALGQRTNPDLDPVLPPPTLLGPEQPLSPAAGSHGRDGITEYVGVCDASAAVPLPGGRFLVGDDETNILRVYAVAGPREPLEMFGLNGLLQPDLARPEVDIEGATSVGNRTFWITSHGVNRNGNVRSSRYRLWAMDYQTDGKKTKLILVGKPYTGFARDLIKAPQLRHYNFARAAAIPPKDDGGLAIEGLSATPDGRLLVGFRNPIPHGRALIVPINNPNDVVMGCPAELGAPIELDLGNLGIRSMEYWPARGMYLIVAGPNGGGGPFRLYRWLGDPDDKPVWVQHVDFGTMTPEALIVYPENPLEVQILSDDGLRLDDQCRTCKSLRDPLRRRFRSIWVTP